MGINRGKQFEDRLREQFENLDNTFCLRLYDVTMGYSKINNPCDLVVYKNGTLNLFELKAIHGNCLNFKAHIRDNQWDKLLKYSKIPGVNAGIICWFIDLDLTYYIPIEELHFSKVALDKKSFNAKSDEHFTKTYKIFGEKKRTFFDYDLENFLEEISYE